MKIIGLMLAKNEAWILRNSLFVASQWVDGIIVLDHGSTDDTQDVLAEFPLVHVIRNYDAGWPEMEHRQMTLDAGRDHRGTHFAVIDADEAITANLVSSIRGYFKSLSNGQALTLPMIPAWRSLSRYRTDRAVPEHITLGWRDKPGIQWRPANGGYQHHSRLPRGARKTKKIVPFGGIVHYQFADWERFIWKHRWYKLHEAVTYPSKPIQQINDMYDRAPDEAGLRVAEMSNEWLWPGGKDRVKLGAPSWYAEECRSLLRMAKRMDRVAGLELWGLR